MTDAREVIAGYLSTGCSLENNAWNEVFLPEADSILQALEQAGYAVVPHYEKMRMVVTEETVTYYDEDGSIAHQSTRTTNPPSPSHREKAPR